MAEITCFRCYTEYHGVLCPKCGADIRNRPSKTLHGVLLRGQYRIAGDLGEGGCGRVFHAEDKNLGQSVAIKELHVEDPDSLIAEAALLSQLRHPNIVGFRQLLQQNGQWYLVMDYVEGSSLSGLVRTGRLYEGDCAQ